MLLNRLWANDDQFKTLTFRPGLNLIVAERTSSSNIGDSCRCRVNPDPLVPVEL